jgi:hypothetical protein
MGLPTAGRQRSMAASLESAKANSADPIREQVTSKLRALSSEKTQHLPKPVVFGSRILPVPLVSGTLTIQTLLGNRSYVALRRDRTPMRMTRMLDSFIT